jgi:CRP/FNR family transcriptional regulator, anaerobic regulatory protein
LIEIKAADRGAVDSFYRGRSLFAPGTDMTTTSSIKTPGAAHQMEFGSSQAGIRAAPSQTALPGGLGSHATILNPRRGQGLALTGESGEMAFFVRSGALILYITLPGQARQVAALLFPGDMIRSSFAPPDAEATLVAPVLSEVLRIRFSTVETLAGSDPAIMRFLNDNVANRVRRQALHAATLGQLDCEQRVATLLVELALRTGAKSPQGVAFDMPFNRKDVAAYLGLNPDTLSRIMSRFRGVLFHTNRSRIVVRDFAALAARTPAAKSLLAMSGIRS